MEKTEEELEQEAFDNEVDNEVEVEVEVEEEEIEVVEEEPWKKLENRLRTVEGRYGSMNSTMQTLNSELNKIASKSSDGPSKKEVTEALKSGEKLSALIEDYPDIGAGIKELEASLKAQIDTLQKPLDEKELRQRAMMDMHFMHKETVVKGEDGEEIRTPVDWEATLATQEFNTWYAEQDEKTQALARSPYARDATKLLDSYLGLDDHKPVVVDRNKRRLAAAVAPTSGRSRSGTAAPTEQEAFDAHYKTGRL